MDMDNPTMASQEFHIPGHSMSGSQGVGHEWQGPHASAFGTEHPVDKALGRVRRASYYKNLAKGSGPSSSESLQHAAATFASAAPMTQERPM